MKKQTSVDWLIEKLSTIDSHHLCEDGILDLIFNNARKMHREEVVNSFTKGQLDIIEVIMPIPDEIKVDTEDGENYYTQTFETP